MHEGVASCKLALTESFILVQAWGWPFLLRLAAAHRRRQSRPTTAHPLATGVHAVLLLYLSSSQYGHCHTFHHTLGCAGRFFPVLSWRVRMLFSSCDCVMTDSVAALLSRLGPWGLELDPNWGGPNAAAQQLGRTGSSSAPALMGRPGDANGWPGPPAGLGAAVPAAAGPPRLAGPSPLLGRAASLGGPGPSAAAASHPQPQPQLHGRPGTVSAITAVGWLRATRITLAAMAFQDCLVIAISNTFCGCSLGCLPAFMHARRALQCVGCCAC